MTNSLGPSLPNASVRSSVAYCISGCQSTIPRSERQWRTQTHCLGIIKSKIAKSQIQNSDSIARSFATPIPQRRHPRPIATNRLKPLKNKNFRRNKNQQSKRNTTKGVAKLRSKSPVVWQSIDSTMPPRRRFGGRTIFLAWNRASPAAME